MSSFFRFSGDGERDAKTQTVSAIKESQSTGAIGEGRNLRNNFSGRGKLLENESPGLRALLLLFSPLSLSLSFAFFTGIRSNSYELNFRVPFSELLQSVEISIALLSPTSRLLALRFFLFFSSSLFLLWFSLSPRSRVYGISVFLRAIAVQPVARENGGGGRELAASPCEWRPA